MQREVSCGVARAERLAGVTDDRSGLPGRPSLRSGGPVGGAVALERACADELEEATRAAGLTIRQLRDILRYAFARFDVNSDGIISKEEFMVACDMLSLGIPAAHAEKLFLAFSKDNHSFAPQDVEPCLKEGLKDQMVANLEEWYSESGMIKGEYLMEKIAEALTQGQMPLHERLQLAWQNLKGQGEAFMEFAEFLIAAALLVAKLQCFPACENVDPTDLVAALIVLGKGAGQLAALLDDRSTNDLSEEDATVLAAVFKPAGFSVASFQHLQRHAEGLWVSLPVGTRLPAAVFTKALGIVGQGKLLIRRPSTAAPGIAETVCKLGRGGFLGTLSGQDGGHRVSSLWSKGAHFVEVTEEARILRWDAGVLQKYLAAHKDARRDFHSAFSHSALKMAGSVNERAGEIGRELSAFFRDTLLHLMSQYSADRVSLWVHDSKRKVLWTLFVKADGSSSYFEIGDASGLAGHSFSHGEVVNVSNCYVDGRFNMDVDKTTGYRTQSVMCVPVIGQDDHSPIGVIQLINRLATSKDSQEKPKADVVPFTSADEESVKTGIWQAALMVKYIGKRYNAR